MTDQKSDNWFTLNAIECWLHHFPKHEWTAHYITMRDALQALVKAEETALPEEEKKDRISSRQSKTQTTKSVR